MIKSTKPQGGEDTPNKTTNININEPTTNIKSLDSHFRKINENSPTLILIV